MSSPSSPSQALPSIPDHLLRSLLASVLCLSDDDIPSPPWTIASGKKGYAAIADRDLPLGAMLIAESPICVWNQHLSQDEAQVLFDALSPNQQAAYLRLCKSDGVGAVDDEILSRRSANGFALQLPVGVAIDGSAGPGEVLSFVFELLSRLNHSCTPNVAQSMNFQTLQMELYTLAELRTGTELTIDYLTPSLVTLSRADRHQRLFDSFGFTKCYCDTCCLPEDESIASDKRREEIGRITSHLGDTAAERYSGLARIRILLAEEGYLGLPDFEDPYVKDAYAAYSMVQLRLEREQDVQPDAGSLTIDT